MKRKFQTSAQKKNIEHDYRYPFSVKNFLREVKVGMCCQAILAPEKDDVTFCSSTADWFLLWQRHHPASGMQHAAGRLLLLLAL